MFEKIKAIFEKIFYKNGGYINYMTGTDALPIPYTPDEEQEKIS